MIEVSRRSRKLDRDATETRDASLIVIATEGEKTEDLYFSSLRTRYHCRRLRIHVIPSEDGKSAPKHIIKNLMGFITDNEIRDGDFLWLAIDKDRWSQTQIADIVTGCIKSGIHLAVSNPCFELWLALHFSDEIPLSPAFGKGKKQTGIDSISKGALEKHLKSIMAGYNKSKYKADPLMDSVQLAIEQAKNLDQNPDVPWPSAQDTWPQSPRTRVYRIVEQVIALAKQA